MTPYTQVTPEERFALSLLRRQGLGVRAIARVLTRAPSTISREMRRHVWREDRRSYLPGRAQWDTNHRRRIARRHALFPVADWAKVEARLRRNWSPEQIVGWFARLRILAISHETIDRHVWQDKQRGGTLWHHLRTAYKPRRKRYGRIVTLVERNSGFTAIGRLRRRAAPELNARLRHLVASQPRPVRSITVDNGTEFHTYRALEAHIRAKFYLATPHHARERGTNKNTNGLIRQYLPKRTSMEHITQRDCQCIADTLNRRLRKRLGFRTPQEVYAL